MPTSISDQLSEVPLPDRLLGPDTLKEASPLFVFTDTVPTLGGGVTSMDVLTLHVPSALAEAEPPGGIASVTVIVTDIPDTLALMLSLVLTEKSPILLETERVPVEPASGFWNDHESEASSVLVSVCPSALPVSST